MLIFNSSEQPFRGGPSEMPCVLNKYKTNIYVYIHIYIHIYVYIHVRGATTCLEYLAIDTIHCKRRCRYDRGCSYAVSKYRVT